MILRNKNNGQVLDNVKLTPTSKVYSSKANEAEVESVFEEYLKDIGYGSVGGLFTKRMARSKLDKFPSKTGSKDGFPDYIFYEDNHSEKIVAIGDAKTPSVTGDNNSIVGLSDCTDIYLKDYNKKHKDQKIKVAFGYDGINFIIKYLDEQRDEWIDILIDNDPLTVMPSIELLNSIVKYGSSFTTQIRKSISKDLLEPYFSRCDAIFRMAKNSLSAVDKAAEISIFIFLKIFSNDKLDEKFIDKYEKSVWSLLQAGSIGLVNATFKEFLNEQYTDIFPDELIKISGQSAKDLAKVIDTMFSNCKIDRMTDIKGNALEYFQKASKDRKIGEFFTPRHLIELMLFLTNPQIEFKADASGEFILNDSGNRVIERIEKVYDPACGSGGFLIQTFLAYINKYEKYGVSSNDLREDVVFGNELKDRTVMLTKLNMILLGDGHNHISNENALSYKKVAQLQKIKNDEGKYIEIQESDIEYKKEPSGTEEAYIPYDKNTGDPVLIQNSNIKYFLAIRKEDGQLQKKRNSKELDPSKVGERENADTGEIEYFVKETDDPVIKKGSQKDAYYRAQIKVGNDEVTPVYEFIDINAVNHRVKEFHNGQFGKFDVVMANHPYALEEPSKPDEYFVDHMLESLDCGGRLAFIVGEKLLFDRNHKSFRKKISSNNTVEAIISLPQGVFNPYTDVKTSIILIKKEEAPDNHKTWMVNVNADGFDLNTTRSPISQNDIPKLKRLWEKWGGYFIDDGYGASEYRSFHKEELGFAEFHKLDEKNWCVKRYNMPLACLNSDYDLKPIKDVLKRSKERITIQDDCDYKQITIKSNYGGVFLREVQKGSNIGTKSQYLVREGQFIMSKIDARNGAFGIVPKDLDGAIITGNFWTFDINFDLVHPEYIINLIQHEFFLKMCNVCSYGTTNRWYLDEDTFENYKIPIPDKDYIHNKMEPHLSSIKQSYEKVKQEKEKIQDIIDNIVEC